MGDFTDFYKSVGIDCSLSEFKEKLNHQNKPYSEYKDVKTLYIPEGRFGKSIERKDIGTLLLVPYGSWRPKYGGGWGTAGKVDTLDPPVWYSGYNLPNDLTQSEALEICSKFAGFGTTIRLNHGLEHRSDGDKAEYDACYEALRKRTQEKLDALPKTKILSHTINGEIFEYVVNIKNTMSEYSEDLSYSYYFYDKDGNYIDSIGNHGAIYG